MVGVVAGITGIEQLVGFIATKILDFHIMVIDFFGGMKEFMIEISSHQVWVFGLYLVMLMPFVIGLIRRKMIKCKKSENN